VRLHRDDGMVTAETAVVLPVLLLVLAGAVAAVVVVGGQLRCVDAAREGVRAAARGETAEIARSVAARAAPSGATTALSESDATVTVTVTARLRPLGAVPISVQLSASATAQREPATQEDGG
jgi:Flp pilus assembly protein TadG